MGAYYERASVVCVPSRREGYGFTAREAMAYGRPVVATPVGGLLDAVTDGVTGLIAAPGELRTAVRTVLEDDELRQRLGAGASAQAREHWTQTTAAAHLVATYAKAS
jgi:glycosyltransferase involved in cell wall biosynthesis